MIFPFFFFFQFISNFTEEGTYQIQVFIFNQISRETATLSVKAELPIYNMSFSISQPYFYGTPAILSLYVEGTKDFNYTCDFGDGNIQTGSHKLNIQEANEDLDMIPVHEVMLEHIYSQAGQYNITVQVSSGLSSLTRTQSMFADQIEIYLSSPPVRVLYENITATAVVTSGQNLIFDWKLDKISDFNRHKNELKVIRSE